MVLHDNLLDPEIVSNPYPYFHKLREESPVHWNGLWEGWVLTRYDDVAGAFQDSRLSAARMKPPKNMPVEKVYEMESTFKILSKWMVFNDPPDHTRLRMIVNKAFTPKAVDGMGPRIQEISDYLLDQVEGRGQMDIIGQYAYSLPIIVISEMLGLPAEDRDLIKKWSDDLMLLVFGAVNVPDRHERAQKSLQDMADYLRSIAEARRKNPQEDLITSIVSANEDGDYLTMEEVIATSTLLVFGGHETTTNLIANGLYSLLENPNELQQLQKQPDLILSAINEILRYEGPSKAMIRIAKEDITIGGQTIEQGQRLLLMQAAANRDPARFVEPDQFDIQRPSNQHLGFGRGIHYCLGAPLARLEGSIAINRIIERFSTLQLDTDRVEWQPTIINRALKALPVAF